MTSSNCNVLKLVCHFVLLVTYFSNGLAQSKAEILFRDWVRDPSIAQKMSNPTRQNGQPGASSQSFSSYALIDTTTAKHDESISNHIATNILQFSRNLLLQLDFNRSEVFSPVSLMASLAYLMLGAKGSSYLQLKQLFATDSLPELQTNPNRFYQELGYLLEDAQQHIANSLRVRDNAEWRNTLASENTRTSSNRNLDHIMKIANGIFVQTGFSLNPDYSYVIRSIYHSELTSLDFKADVSGARKYLNDWVNRNTLGKIPKIVESESDIRNAQFIIANTIYFKGFWEYNFFHSATREENFYPDGLQQPPIRITMMATGGTFPYYASEKFNCRIIGFPYQDNATTMYIIQPNDSSREKLRQLQSQLSALDIEDLIVNMKRTMAVVAFPKMHFARGYRMASLLSNIGINDLFSATKSDLSLIGNNVQQNQLISDGFSSEPLFTDTFDSNKQLVFKSRINIPGENKTDTATNSSTTTQTLTTKSKRQTQPLPLIDRDFRSRYSLQQLETQRYSTGSKIGDIYVDEVLHSVDIVINEEGTEAAAATVVTLKKSSQILFRAETPFLFLIRHDPTKLTLFYGAVNKPEQ